MNTLLLYLVQSAVCMGTLFGVYWIFLRRDTFFRMNRFYLLIMVFFSMFFPLFPVSWIPANPAASVAVMLEPVLITPSRMEQALQTHLQWIEIAAVVYFTGVIIFLLRFILQLVQIYLITWHTGISKRKDQRVVFTDRGYSPFSFFNLVFINEAVIPADSLPTILEHELIHIRQFHSVDLNLVETATILQWFNPIIWLVGREIKSIHEYLADDAVLQNGIILSQYQQMILNETMGIRVNGLTNNFNVSLLKKRIAMMTKSKSKTRAKSKVLFALPVLLGLGLVVTAHTYRSFAEANIPGTRVVEQAGLIPNPEQVVQDKQKKETEINYVTDKTGKKVYKVVEKMPSYKGGDEARIKFLVGNIKYPEEAMKNRIQGKVFVNFIVRTDGSVTDVNILRGIRGGCDEEAMRVVKMMPAWNPGMEKGKPVDVLFNLPIKFALDSGKKDEKKEKK